MPPPAPIPLWVSPSGAHGYIPIYKNGSTSFQYHFQRVLRWRRAWPDWFDGRTKDTVDNPDPRKILVITRDPMDRWESALRQVGEVWDDQHLWPQGRFLTDWRQFLDRMEFVDLAFANDWLVDEGFPACEERRNVTVW